MGRCHHVDQIRTRTDGDEEVSLSSFEREIITELHGLIGKRIREKDLLEWRTREIAERKGERVFHLKGAGVWVAIPAALLP